MARFFSIGQLGRMRPPVRRVLALDAGHRRLKLLLAESDFGRLRLLKEELLDLQAEGLVAAEEIKAHLQATLAAWGNPPLALVLPQHLSISQVVELPPAPESEVEKLIAEETIKLSGVSESRIVYDFVRTEAPSPNRQQFWVTLSQEGEVREHIQRLGLEQEDLCEVTTTANALIAAYRALHPLSARAILVHLGAQTTTVVILLAGQGVFATSFQMGGDFFTRSLARLQESAEPAAEALKQQQNLLTGPEAVPGFVAVVEGWAAELKRQLNEWFREHPALAAEVSSFDLIASGGAFGQPGLLEYLKHEAGLPFGPWPKSGQPEMTAPSPGFEVAFGTALQALGYSAQPVSLLPQDYRLAWQKRLGRQRIDLASTLLLLLCALVLGLGTWQKSSLLRRKQTLLAEVQSGLKALQANEALTAQLLNQYESLRPVLAEQQNSLDTLKMLSLLQQSRSNRPFWYVLLADQQSYFSSSLRSTNRTNSANLLAPLKESNGNSPFPLGTPLPFLTNTNPAKPGFIAELCVPGEAEAARQNLSELVNGLKQQALFSKVDLLSDDLRRNLADPKLIITDRYFVVALDFAQTDFQLPVRPKRNALPRARAASQRSPHFPNLSLESAAAQITTSPGDAL